MHVLSNQQILIARIFFRTERKSSAMTKRNIICATIIAILTIFSSSCKKTVGTSGGGTTTDPVKPANGNIVSTTAESSNLSAFNSGPHGICADSEDNIYFSTDA